MTRLPAVYNGNNNPVMRFEYADARMPFAMTAGGAVYYLAYDQVASLRVVADSSGTVVKRIDYDSFGNAFCDSAPDFAVPFGFAGGLYDKDTELVRFGYRDYDPDTGRWTAKDPIGFAGGDSDLYGYCVNDPINLFDSDGTISSSIINWGKKAWNHIAKRHISKKHYPKKSKFKKPSQIRKNAEKTVKSPNCVTRQKDGRMVYEKDFGREIGTNDETIQRVVTEKNGDIVTTFPASEFLSGVVGVVGDLLDPAEWIGIKSETAGPEDDMIDDGSVSE